MKLLPLLTLLLLLSCSTDEADRMRQALQHAREQNKAYEPVTGDTLLRDACHYFDRHGTANERVEAYYLLGCAYRDRNEAPQALECYQDAIDAADTTAADCDFRLLMSVSGQMAVLFHYQNLPTNEIAARQAAQRYAQMAKDTFGYIRSYETMIRPYYLMGDTQKILDLAEKSRSLYLQYGYKKESYNNYGVLIDINVKRGNLALAKQLISDFETHSNAFDSSGNIRMGR